MFSSPYSISLALVSSLIRGAVMYSISILETIFSTSLATMRAVSSFISVSRTSASYILCLSHFLSSSSDVLTNSPISVDSVFEPFMFFKSAIVFISIAPPSFLSASKYAFPIHAVHIKGFLNLNW